MLRCECKQRDYDDLEGLGCTKIVQAYRCTMGNIGNSLPNKFRSFCQPFFMRKWSDQLKDASVVHVMQLVW